MLLVSVTATNKSSSIGNRLIVNKQTNTNNYIYRKRHLTHSGTVTG